MKGTGGREEDNVEELTTAGRQKATSQPQKISKTRKCEKSRIEPCKRHHMCLGCMENKVQTKNFDQKIFEFFLFFPKQR